MRRREFVTGAVAGLAGLTAGKVVSDRFAAAAPPTLPDGARMSFSQQGEDIVLFHAVRDVLKLERATYMDVGAAHPFRASNTYLMYGTGDRGLLVEPNPMFVKLLRSYRPGDIVLQAGIGVSDVEEADYYEIKDNPWLNTFSAETVERLQRGQAASVVERVVKMPLVNINRAIAEHLGRAPDLLSTDVEGLDYAILQALDLNTFRPGVICSEGVPMFAPEGRHSDIAKYLLSRDYVLRGGSMVNSIFVDGRRLNE
jgi:FkbM family methyltransferase